MKYSEEVRLVALLASNLYRGNLPTFSPGRSVRDYDHTAIQHALTLLEKTEDVLRPRAVVDTSRPDEKDEHGNWLGDEDPA